MPDSALVVFNLPKPLARWWWKGGLQWGEAGEDLKGMVAEYGDFYRDLLPIIWEAIDGAGWSGKLWFDRLNGVGEHDPGKFYYVWEVEKGGR